MIPERVFEDGLNPYTYPYTSFLNHCAHTKKEGVEALPYAETWRVNKKT